MNRPRRTIIFIVLLLLIAVVVWRLLVADGPAVQKTAYVEPFDEAGTWTVGNDANAQGQIADGVYEMFVELSGDIFWVTAGRNFADGVYEVEASPIEGAQDNGYGLLFRVNVEEQAFYMFKVSSDGYVWIGRCLNNCAETVVLVDRDWFASTAVQPGLSVTNRLKVVANGPQLTFFVNDEEVGQATDEALTKGDIGLMVETFIPGGLQVNFDNFKVTPVEGGG